MVTIPASENAYVRLSGGDSSEAQTLEIRRSYSTTGNSDRIAYLRFDIAPIKAQLTEAASIGSVKLNLYFVSLEGSIDYLHVNALLDESAETSWTSYLAGGSRPHGTATVGASRNVTVSQDLVTVPLAGGTTGLVAFELSKAILQPLFDSDTNGFIVLVLSASSSKNVVQIASLDNTANYPVPSLEFDLPETSIPAIFEGDFEITGTLDVYGDDLTLGTTSENANGISISYQDDPQTPTTTFQATQPSHEWVFQSNGASGTPTEQFRIGADGSLRVSNSSGSFITIDPDTQSLHLSGGGSFIATDASGDLNVAGDITSAGSITTDTIQVGTAQALNTQTLDQIAQAAGLFRYDDPNAEDAIAYFLEDIYDYAVDALGNVYVTGYDNKYDAYVAKLDANMNLIWTQTFGGASSDSGTGIALGSDGSVFVAGNTRSPDFSGAGLSSPLLNHGGTDSFILKLSGSSGIAEWAQTFGGASDDYGTGIALGSDQEIIAKFDFASGVTVGSQQAMGNVIYKFSIDWLTNYVAPTLPLSYSSKSLSLNGGKAGGQNAFALGADSAAMGNSSTAFASGSAIGANSFAWGSGFVEGENSTAWGNASASADNSTAWGYGIVVGNGSTAWGRAYVFSYLSTGFGQYNIYATGGDPLNWIDLDPLLEIGNGTSWSNQTNALTILKDGRMALGTHTTMDDLRANPETVQIQGSALVKDSLRVDTGNVELTNGDIVVANGAIYLANPAGDIPMFGE